MLAKMWKKVLLAVCIVACLFNVISKLVNRHSLKENLESANDGVLVYDIFTKDEESDQQTVETTGNEGTKQENEVVDNKVEKVVDGETGNNEIVNETQNNKAMNYKDFTIIF